MYRISDLSNAFHLSRSTLLYYDSIGLLKPSERTSSNYRLYSEEDKERLIQIHTYREAGVSLEEIKELLDSKVRYEDIFKKRLKEVNNQIYLLRIQQKIMLQMLGSSCEQEKFAMMDDSAFASLLVSSGIESSKLSQLHAEFERRSPEEHQAFLEFLGLDQDSIYTIREKSRKYNKR
jgi:DNA-binding transcriptional MerR regulator